MPSKKKNDSRQFSQNHPKQEHQCTSACDKLHGKSDFTCKALVWSDSSQNHGSQLCQLQDKTWKDQNWNSEIPAEYGPCQLQDKARKDQNQHTRELINAQMCNTSPTPLLINSLVLCVDSAQALWALFCFRFMERSKPKQWNASGIWLMPVARQGMERSEVKQWNASKIWCIYESPAWG